MKTMSGMLKAVLGVAMLATVCAPLGHAQCASVSVYKRSALMLQQPFSSRQFRPIAFTSVAHAAALRSHVVGEALVQTDIEG